MHSPLHSSGSTILSPTFRISTYSALEGALGDQPTMNHTSITHAVDAYHEPECSEPPELAVYTVGVYDNYDNDFAVSNDKFNEVQPIHGWNDCSSEAVWSGHCADMSTPSHEYGHGLYYDYNYAWSYRDPSEPPVLAEPCCTTNASTSYSSPEDIIRSYRITEEGEMRCVCISPPPPSPYSSNSERSSVTADFESESMHGEHESIKSESYTPSPYTRTQALHELRPELPTQRRSHTPPPRRRLRPTTLLACYYCRKRKIRCGGPDPTDELKRCKQCIHRKRECEFPEKSNRGRRPSKASSLHRDRDVTARG